MIDFSEIEPYYGPLSVEDLDAAVAAVQNADSTPDASHTGNLISSAGVATGLAAKADKADLASISLTGTTNNTGATIPQGTFFYLSGTLVRATADIANGATLTSGTNYEAVTSGGLNRVESDLLAFINETVAVPKNISVPVGKTLTITVAGAYVIPMIIATSSNRQNADGLHFAIAYNTLGYAAVYTIHTADAVGCSVVSNQGIVISNNSDRTVRASILFLNPAEAHHINYVVST